MHRVIAFLLKDTGANANIPVRRCEVCFARRLRCIGDQIHKHLIQFARLAGHGGHIGGQIHRQRHVVLERRAQNDQGGFQQVIQVGFRSFIPIHAAENSKPFDNFRRACCPIIDACQQLVNFIHGEGHVQLDHAILQGLHLLLQGLIVCPHRRQHAQNLGNVIKVAAERLGA